MRQGKSRLYVATAGVISAAALLLSACGDSGEPAATPSGAPVSGVITGGGPGPDTGGETGPGIGGQTVGGPVDSSKWLLPTPFYAVGDEPAWRLDIDDGFFQFRRSGLPVIEAIIPQPTRTGSSDVFDSPPLKVSIRLDSCEVSGRLGQATVDIQLDGVDYDGCAFSGGGGAGTTDSDQSELAESVKSSLGAIDACLAKLGEPAVVSAVYPRENDLTGVGLRNRNGSLFECASRGTAVDFLDPVEPRQAGAWLKSKARFLREGQGDASNCPDATKVEVAGKTIGRMLTAKCRF